MRRLLLIVCSLLFAAPAMAATKFADINSIGGTCVDTPANGAIDAPWCTISYGVSQLAGGDGLYVREGSYPGVFFISGPAGSAGASTTVCGYNDEAVEIVGAGYGTGRMKIYNTSYFTLCNLSITFSNQGLHVINSTNILIDHVIVHDIGQEGIRVAENSSDVILQYNTVYNTRQWQTNVNGECFYIGSSTPLTLDNTHTVTLLGNTAFNCADEGVELKEGTHDITVDGNIVHDALISPNFSGAGAGAIELDQTNSGTQSWGSNPAHIIRNNRVYSTNVGIRMGTGGTAYNNVIYSINGSFSGILVNNGSGDAYTRTIYHNTIDLPAARAVTIGPTGGTTDIKNNIGPSTTNNLATTDSWYMNKAAANYMLVSGKPPINTGLDLTATVPTDLMGFSRSTWPLPDYGAYEYPHASSGSGAPTTAVVLWDPNTETNLAGYRVYCTFVPGVYGATPCKEITPASAATAHSPLTQRIFQYPLQGDRCFKVTAFNTLGGESPIGQSPEVCKFMAGMVPRTAAGVRTPR